MKKFVSLVLIAVIVVGLAACSSGVSQEEYDKVVAERDALIEERDSLIAERDALGEDLNTITEERNALSAEYESFKADAEPFLQLTEAEQAAELARAEQERIEAEEAARIAQEEADRLAAEKAAEEEAQRQAEEEARLAEEAKGYETGITFIDISRSPDEYIGKKVKFTGYVLQIVEGVITNVMRMSTDGKYNDVIYCTYSPDILDVRLLEDDNITIYGVVQGLETYETILGGSVTLPRIKIDRIEIH